MQEFFKFIFYGGIIILLLRHIILLLIFNSYSEKRRLIKEYIKSLKEKEEKLDFKICPEHIKHPIIYNAIFGVLEMLLILFGLLTFNWLLFFFFLTYSILLGVFMKAVYKLRTLYKGLLFIDFIITIGFYILVILNAYHLKIDFIKFI